jgi:flagellar FliL protein
MATTATRPGAPAPAPGVASAAPAASAASAASAKGSKTKKPRRSKRKKLLLLLPLLLVLAVAAKMLLLGGGATPDAVPKPGPIVSPDAVTVNLKAGHYLRVGIAVQFTDKVSASALPDGAPAIDQTIAYFTGRDGAPLETTTGLADAKKGLKERIAAVYPDDPVYDVLITSFVVQ